MLPKIQIVYFQWRDKMKKLHVHKTGKELLITKRDHIDLRGDPGGGGGGGGAPL